MSVRRSPVDDRLTRIRPTRNSGLRWLVSLRRPFHYRDGERSPLKQVAEWRTWADSPGARRREAGWGQDSGRGGAVATLQEGSTWRPSRCCCGAVRARRGLTFVSTEVGLSGEAAERGSDVASRLWTAPVVHVRGWSLCLTATLEPKRGSTPTGERSRLGVAMVGRLDRVQRVRDGEVPLVPVSYTHLTLPTIYSV